MIKNLFFTAALLAPGLAYAANPSANLPVQIVPAGSNIACDAGPTYTGSVPAPAGGAGFTTCALNADFSNSYYSKTATWINECGATTPWRFYLQGQFGGSVPCNRLTIATDPTFGGTVAHFQYLQNDKATIGQNIFQLAWPGAWLTTTGFPPYLPNEMYYEISFRLSPATLTAGTAWPIDIWQETTRSPCGPGGGPCPPSWVEIDFMEYDDLGQPGSGFKWGGGIIDWPYGNPAYGPVTVGATDLSVYHTLRVLITSDESSAISKCTWIDATPYGCIQVHPQNVPGADAQTTAEEYHQWNNAITFFLGQGGASSISSNLDAYIQSIRLWECSGYKTTRCPGQIITTQ
jgi:hypothetical protein